MKNYFNFFLLTFIRIFPEGSRNFSSGITNLTKGCGLGCYYRNLSPNGLAGK
jgi:hypothetical protein